LMKHNMPDRKRSMEVLVKKRIRKLKVFSYLQSKHIQEKFKKGGGVR